MSFVNTVDIIGDEALAASIIDRSVKEIADNVSTTIRGYAFSRCYELVTANFPNVVSVGWYGFQICQKLTTVILPKVTSIGTYVFWYCSALNKLILSGEAVCALENANAFDSTPIKSGRGYIYVPRALVDSYKAATNWSTLAAQFRALEDYTVDGTTTGELDPTKI